MSVWAQTWEWIRASGISSYFLLFSSVLTGVLYRSKMILKKYHPALLVIHQTTGWFGLIIGLFHGSMTVIDNYISFSLLNLFIPFSSEYQPILTGFGTLSLYAFSLIYLTSDFIKKIGKRLWRTIHMLALPAYFLVFIHGVLLGTDSESLWMIIFYTFTSVMLGSLIFMVRLRSA
ncbi:ferric reductase-like transmembrane domain-containing protein [Bacillus tianshenii]|nr:ferric reductase-like transmembrane domain-containing protein [Bacillus tianshenii]